MTTNKNTKNQLTSTEIAAELAKSTLPVIREPKQNLNIYNMETIDQTMSLAVSKMLANGYQLHSVSMHGSQSDIDSYVDLVDANRKNQKKTYRLALVRSCDDEHRSTLEFNLFIFNRVSHSDMDTLWLQDAAEKHPIAVWYDISGHSTKRVYTNLAGSDKVAELQMNRYIAKDYDMINLLNNKNRKVVAGIVRKHRGYARVRLDDIAGVYRSDMRERMTSSMISRRNGHHDYSHIEYSIVMNHVPSQADRTLRLSSAIWHF